MELPDIDLEKIENILEEDLNSAIITKLWRKIINRIFYPLLKYDIITIEIKQYYSLIK